MANLLFYTRLLVAAVSLVAVLGAPFVIINSTPAPADDGYGVTQAFLDRAEAVDTPLVLVQADEFSRVN